MSSADFDAFLYLVRVSSTQELIPGQLFVDDNTGDGSNPAMLRSIQAGTYWIGVTSFSGGETGDYVIKSSVILP